MELYASGRYAEANPDWHDGDGVHKARAVARMVRWLGLAPATVCDVGCGTGAVLRALVDDLGASLPDTRWEGFDLAPAAIARAKTREVSGLAFELGDFLASERTVDLALCLDVVEHVPDEVAFLERLRSRARAFVFRLPLELSALDVIRPTRLLAARHGYGHRHAWTRELALDLLQTTGYAIDCERYDRVPAPRDTARQRRAELVRSALARVAPHPTARLLGGFSLLVAARPG